MTFREVGERLAIVLRVALAHSEMNCEGLEVSDSRAEMISSMELKRKHLSMAGP